MEERSNGPPEGADTRPSLDVDQLRATLSRQPVRLAVLFGSQADGTADATSDVDVVVELDDTVENRGQAKVDLLTTLSVELDRNDVDLSLVADLDPAVGAVAFTEGILLCGSRDRFQALAERFDDRQSDDGRPSVNGSTGRSNASIASSKKGPEDELRSEAGRAGRREGGVRRGVSGGASTEAVGLPQTVS